MWSLSDNDVWEWNKRTKEPFASRTNTLLVGISKLMGDVSVSIAIDNSLSLPPPPFPSPIVQMDLYGSMLAKVWIKEVTTCSNFPGV